MTSASSPRAHLLLQVDPGRAQEVAAFVAALPAVTEAAVTSGAYDVIVRLDLTTVDLPHVLVQARRAPGLCGVRVCRPAR
jgi:hypothetical protein